MPVQPKPDDQIERVLVVMAHPDDADFGVAGTVAGWTDAGIEVTLLCCTHGEQGARPDADIAAIPALREREQRAASTHLGVHDVRFLDRHRDGWLVPDFDLQSDIVRVIRDVRPQRVVCQSPERNYERIHGSHPDHLAAGEATIRACYPAAENPFAWPELGLPFWHVGEIWVTGLPTGRHAVDITDQFPRKMAALHEHTSQTAHNPQLEEMVRSWNAGLAQQFDLADGRLAESYGIVAVN